MAFDWDRRKAEANLRKHGISFDEAATVFDDPLAVSYGDPDHSFDEDRWLTFGYSASGRLVAVAHTIRGETIRIVSARPATPRERRQHEQG